MGYRDSRIVLSYSILALLVFPCVVYGAQAPSLITRQVDTSVVQPLPNHHPLWANPANETGAVAPNQRIGSLTLVLTRPAERQSALNQFLADQKDSASPNYRHWLTAAEVGQRFGLSDSDIAEITGWLQSQGLHVNWVAPSRIFLGFEGTAADVSRAFQTELHTYRVNGKARISVCSDPVIPEAVAPAIKAIHGLYTIDEQPQHISTAMESTSPAISASDGTHFIGPGDFAKIYDLPAIITGAGITIGIVGRSRTNAADFDNFKSLAGASFADPSEVVPLAYGGVDPGPAYTSPPGTGVSIDDQAEATLDILRAGSVAPRADLLLVAATKASGGIEADAQYLVNTTPVPAQVMTISFGTCESAAGPSGVSFWDALFQQAAAEGISSFVASGDSGASGCDSAFQAPPASPKANSPNYICSSTYATCVGGTEFNDSNANQYWTTATGGVSTSALSYIPEGGWNESWDGETSTVASSGGGVSTYVAIPSWQKGVVGVPSNNAGRYTPDLSFSSSSHDGYFACFAAGGGSCVVSGNSFYYSVFAGTSAAAPSMAGIAALLDQSLGAPQGNLNPGIYQMSVSAPAAFHDVTLASSGVTTCDLNRPSMCNNSIPGHAGLSGGQPGFAIGAGYDEVTGLGSLDAATFVYAYGTASKIFTPTVALYTSPSIATNQPLSILIVVSSAPYSPAPTGNLTVTIGSYVSAVTALSSSSPDFDVPAGALPVGSYTLSVTYTPDSASAPIYTSASASQPLTVIVPPKVSPSITLTPSQQVISNSQAMTIGVVVHAVQYYPSPTGSVTVTSGSYTSTPVALIAGSATITVPAGSLAVGSDTLTVTYTPDAASSPSYLSNSSAILVRNDGEKITPHVSMGAISPVPTTAVAFAVPFTVDGFTGNPIPTGMIVLTSGTYTSAAASLLSGNATINIPAGVLPPGVDTLSATYSPDAQSSSLFSSSTISNDVGVTLAQKITPAIAFTQLTSSPTTLQPLSLTITLTGGGTNPAPTGTVMVGANSPTIYGTLSGGSATVTLPPGSFAGGANTITAEYFPDTPAAYIYNQESATTTVAVAKATPTVTLTPSAPSAATTDSMNVTVTVGGGNGAPTATGTVKLTSGTYSSVQGLTLGATTIYIAPGLLVPGTDALTATYAGDTDYNSATATNTVSVTAPADAGFAVSGTSLTLVKGSSGDFSKVTVTPTVGFVGVVSLTAAITDEPSGAQDPPTLSFGSTSPVNVTGFNPAMATLSITTTSASSGALNYPARLGAPWYTTGGALLACFLFFVFPAQRRRWLSLIGMFALAVFLAASATSCGGGGGVQGGGGGGGNPGTTSGQYTIKISATSGATTASNTILLTVQ